MANDKNLKHFGKEKPVLTHEQAVEYGMRGKIASDKAKAEKKKMAELVKLALEQSLIDKNGNKIEYKGAVANKLVMKMLGGDLKAIELGLKLIGEMPSEKTEITGANGSPIVAPVLNIIPVKPENND
ncbi:MAG: hypothetical protein J6T10_30015 [Methanobrevibacter sp.]|nr:hypothetical protein [Methanobrevibacter sp.]